MSFITATTLISAHRAEITMATGTRLTLELPSRLLPDSLVCWVETRAQQ